jgi:signal transduction histidine kinase
VRRQKRSPGTSFSSLLTPHSSLSDETLAGVAMKGKAKHCLLVVDDEPDLVHSVQDLLRFEYRVLGATRAAEGLQIADREQVHIVMSDQRMPEMTGVEFLKRLRERHPDVVRLLFTAYADIKAVIDAINQGNVYRYITKPWEPPELMAVLRQAAEHYDLLTERKRLLGELQEKNQQLEAANQELRQANDLKKAFIKVASHELRTPLTIVLGLSDLSRRTPGVQEPLAHWLERIYAGSVRLNGRIDLMIKLLLADRFERHLDRKPVDLAGLLRSAAADVATFVEQRRQALEVDAPPDLGTVAVEEDKLRDSVFQLLINAVKFTPDGGTVRLSARRTFGGGAEIRVSDTGVGLDAASLARVFDPFFTRFDVSRHSSGVYEFERRGLGLGLTVVKAFVEMHGGRVTAESEPGKGSTFIITLPPQTEPATNGEGHGI